MTGQDIQARVDAIVQDLQTTARGKSVQILLRDQSNNSQVFTLSSDANGNIPQGQLDALQGFINLIKPAADTYEAEYTDIKTASDAFNQAREAHKPLFDAASAARTALNDALEQDANYQAAKTAVDDARNDPAFIAARNQYKQWNVSENYGNLGDAKGKYV